MGQPQETVFESDAGPDVHSHCPVCKAPSPFKPLDRFEEVHLAECTRCSHRFANRIPTRHELEANYAGYPRGAPISDLTRARINEVLDSLDAFRNTGRLVDYGCGSGHYLTQAAALGWDATGFEFDPEAINQCLERGLSAHPLNSLDDLPDSSVDVVLMIEVIEHVADPRATLGILARKLRSGGAVYITTPNFGSVTRLGAGMRWRVMSYPEHLQYFDKSSLRHLLDLGEFDVRTLATHNLSPGVLVEPVSRRLGRGTLTRGEAGPATAEPMLREAMARSSAARRVASMTNFIVSKLGIGDTLKATAIKKGAAAWIGGRGRA